MREEIQTVRISITEVTAGLSRIDSYIADELKLFSRSQVKRRVRRALVNGREVKLSRHLKSGDLLEVWYSDPPPVELIPEEIELNILYEDRNVLVIDKPPGMVVHPGCGNRSGTLVNAVLHYCSLLRETFPDESLRPGIVHRLDKDTSGVIILAKSHQALDFLAGQFRSGRVKKQYLAILRGSPKPPAGRIETLICRDPHNRKRFTAHTSSGKRALTLYRVVKSFSGYSLISLRPRSGRSHQLRVHMAFQGCPILGDPIYSRKAHYPMMLHAFKLWIRLPGDETPRLFRAPLPERFLKAVRSFEASPEGRD
ncbi:Ribosomal large subunit pseudouridine synthase D [subsurface metagenome]